MQIGQYREYESSRNRNIEQRYVQLFPKAVANGVMSSTALRLKPNMRGFRWQKMMLDPGYWLLMKSLDE